MYNFAYRAVSANRWKKAELVSVMAGNSLVFVIEISHVRYSGQHASILNPDLAKYDISFTQINGKATRRKRHKVLPFRWKGQSKGKQKRLWTRSEAFYFMFSSREAKAGKKLFSRFMYRQKSSVTNKKQDENRPFSQRKSWLGSSVLELPRFCPNLVGVARNWFRSYFLPNPFPVFQKSPKHSHLF